MAILLIDIILKYNIILIFYVSLCCLISVILLIFHNMNNGDYIIIIRGYFGIDTYSFYIILLRVCVIGLMYLSLIRKDEIEINKLNS